MYHTKTRILHFIFAIGVFFIIYNSTNAYSQLLFDTIGVPSIIFPIDNYIPFIPPTLIFYMCSWLLIVVAFFFIYLNDLSRFTYRFILSTLFSGIIYYHIPLYFSFERNEFIFWGINWQNIYTIIMSMDKPFNQSPSLHVIYAIIIAYSLKETLKSWHIFYRLSFYLICFLTAISTLFTWQHHSIDVLTGILFSLLLLKFENWLYKTHTHNTYHNIIKYIITACFLFIILAILPTLSKLNDAIILSTKYIAYYILISFLMVSFVYHKQEFVSHSKITKYFMKNHLGQLNFLTKLLFMPYLLSYYFIWQLSKKLNYCTTQNQPIIITKNDYSIHFITTTKLSYRNLSQLTQNYHTIIYMDTNVELSTSLPNTNINYIYCPFLDLTAFDDTQYHRILNYCQTAESKIQKQDTLIICQCVLGKSRSIAMMACLIAYFAQYNPKKIHQLLSEYTPNHLAQKYIDNNTLIRLANNR